MLSDTYDFLCKLSFQTLEIIIRDLYVEEAIAAANKQKEWVVFRDYRERVEYIMWQVVIPFHPSPEACHHKMVLACHALYGNPQ